MRQFLVVMVGMACLSACTILPPVDPDPPATQGVLMQQESDLTCDKLTITTKQKIIDRWGMTALRASDLVGAQVAVGDGLEENHTWWVISYQRPRPEGAYYGASYFITDAPAPLGETTWIQVWIQDGHLSDWGQLAWTGSLRERGEAALFLVRTCPVS
ncbi:MAG: hypothetical protein FWD75_04990 [Propionibacteriaceae bacterium]|nr:hypothetical protein [Propionibacteriaceae bacterium]